MHFSWQLYHDILGELYCIIQALAPIICQSLPRPFNRHVEFWCVWHDSRDTIPATSLTDSILCQRLLSGTGLEHGSISETKSSLVSDTKNLRNLNDTLGDFVSETWSPKQKSWRPRSASPPLVFTLNEVFSFCVAVLYFSTSSRALFNLKDVS